MAVCPECEADVEIDCQGSLSAHSISRPDRTDGGSLVARLDRYSSG